MAAYNSRWQPMAAYGSRCLRRLPSAAIDCNLIHTFKSDTNVLAVFLHLKIRLWLTLELEHEQIVAKHGNALLFLHSCFAQDKYLISILSTRQSCKHCSYENTPKKEIYMHYFLFSVTTMFYQLYIESSKTKRFRQRSNLWPSACEVDVITTTLRNRVGDVV